MIDPKAHREAMKPRIKELIEQEKAKAKAKTADPEPATHQEMLKENMPEGDWDVMERLARELDEDRLLDQVVDSFPYADTSVNTYFEAILGESVFRAVASFQEYGMPEKPILPDTLTITDGIGADMKLLIDDYSSVLCRLKDVNAPDEMIDQVYHQCIVWYFS